jgi:hypothetical protein
MPVLHYGSDLHIYLDDEVAKQAVEDIGHHASRGGWVSLTDREGAQWSLLITAGIPVWVAPDD